MEIVIAGNRGLRPQITSKLFKYQNYCPKYFINELTRLRKPFIIFTAF